MIPIPMASFLAGAILSLVLPAGLLVVTVVWYHIAQKQIAEPSRRTPAGSTPTNPPPANPGQPDPPASAS
jgi:predicted membrane metal-binding protein